VKSSARERRVRFEEAAPMKRAKLGLAGLKDGVERWRQERAHVRAPAPEELWNAAVEVARKEGVYATAKAIRFDSSRLKARMSRAPSAGSRGRSLTSPTSGAPKTDATAFVAIEVAGPGGGATTSEAVVELVGRHGDRMRIVAAHGAVDVVGLAQAFWSRAS
jgi:hypothetical protein